MATKPIAKNRKPAARATTATTKAAAPAPAKAGTAMGLKPKRKR